MALTEEWKHRIEAWEKALWASCYRPLGSLNLDGFTTFDRLTSKQAQKQTFYPMPSGTRWGVKWEYGWFQCNLTLPTEATGHRCVLCIDPFGKSHPDGESLVWINGKIAGSYGWARKEITLSRNAVAGELYTILLEAYAGHSPISVGEGPVLYGSHAMPEPDQTQAVIGESTYGIWEEETYQLALDFTTLFELRNRLDPLSLRTSQIDRGLMDATLLVDLELPDPERSASIQLCRERLTPLLACKNGSTAPTLFAIGHAHLDVAWLWPWAETERKMARTTINQLALIEEYPEYRFLQSQPQLYIMLKMRYPELYERFVQAIKSGKVVPDGAMWVEADTNISGGESLIRQVMYGRRFFQQEFSFDSRVLWLPDVFGYSGALPQILRGCGCIGFATQKITWTYNGGDPFPYNTFLWEGIDGTTIPAHIFTDYGSHTRPGALLDRWNTRLQKNGINSLIFAFGWGDGGGGPTRDHLEFLRREIDLEGLPRVHIASPAEFFSDLEEHGLPQDCSVGPSEPCRYVGELYFQAHRGTYTSQAKTKQGNRRSEFALREAELWGAAARALEGFDFSSQTLASAWRKLLLNQFHDILPGSSIHRVYEEAEAAFAEIISEAESAARNAASSFTHVSSSTEWVTVFNSLSWSRTILLQLPEGPVEVTVPACGWRSLQRSALPQDIPPNPLVQESVDDATIDHPTHTAFSSVTALNKDKDSIELENEFLKALFNDRGELISLTDKENEREFIAGEANRFCLYKDVPTMWDAWDIDSMTEQAQIEINEPVTLEIITSGPLVARIKLIRKLHHSTLSQIISLRRGSRRIEFATAVDWQESHKLLKVAFPVNIHTNEALHEIQFGHLRRPNHRSRPYDADRFEVCNQKWSALLEPGCGVALLNDCKYGLSVKGNSLNLSLLKSPLAPDPTADRGVQTFTYALYVWNGSFAESNLVREAYELNCPVMILPGEAQSTSLLELDAPNTILETMKPAEDDSTDIILRIYECKGMATRSTLTTFLPVRAALQTDMLEAGGQSLSCYSGKIDLTFRPFEIKTVRLIMQSDRQSPDAE
jgi:alpha-mannosidase